MKKKIILNFLIVFLSLSLIAVAVLTDSNELYYSFDTSDATDLSVNGNDGEVNNGDFVDGKILLGYNSDGTDEYINTTLTFDEDTAFSVNFWYRQTNSSPPNDDTTVIIPSDVSQADSFYWLFQPVDYDTSGGAAFQINRQGVGGITLSNDIPILNHTWYMLTLVYNGSQNGAELYINSVLNDTDTFTNTGSSSVALPYNIGSSPTTPRAINNTIDEFGIWSGALTTDEIDELYNSGFGFNPYYVSFSVVAYDVHLEEFISIFNGTVNNTFYETTNGLLNTTIIKNTTESVNIEIDAQFFDTLTTSIIPNETSGIYQANLTRNDIPSIPTGLSPSNSSQYFSDEVTLSTTGSTSPYGRDLEYQFYNGSNLLQNSTATSFIWASLGFNIHTWKVRAIDNNSIPSNFTDERSFYVIGLNNTAITNPNLALNYTIKDELTGSLVNASSISSTVNLSSSQDSAIFTDSLTNSNTYGLSVYPANVTVNSYQALDLEASGYQQRDFIFNETITGGSATNHVLYMLNTSDGIFVTFQIVDGANSPVSGAEVKAYKTISGQSSLVESGDTDDSGAVTFFLDPTQSHTITVTKAGFNMASLTVTPTQSAYTITLTESTTTQNSVFFGITYSYSPTLAVLNNNTDYNFTFTIASTYYNLSSWGFSISDPNGNVLNSSTSTTPTGGTVSAIVNTGTYEYIEFDYFWVTPDGNFSDPIIYSVREIYEGELSLKNFLRNLSNFNAFGFDGFGLGLIMIIIIVGTVGWVTYEFGIYSPIGISTLLVFLVWILEIGGLMPTLAGVTYGVGILTTIVWIGLLMREFSR